MRLPATGHQQLMCSKTIIDSVRSRPYHIRCRMIGMLPMYQVIFEEQVLFQTRWKDEAKKITGLCNGAHQMGMMYALNQANALYAKRHSMRYPQCKQQKS